MTKFFVDTFNTDIPCQSCKKSALVVGSRTYSVCNYHLTYARERWRAWSSERRGLGKCVNCNGKSFNGWLRCRKHTKINREKCARWMAVYGKEHIARQWARCKAILATGVCICSAHNRLPTGYRRCDDCRARNATRNARTWRQLAAK